MRSTPGEHERKIVGIYSPPILLQRIDCIILRPNNDEPGILYWLSDNTTYLNVFNDDKECDEYWGIIEQGLEEEDDFIRYYDIRFRAKQLRMLRKCYTSELGYSLQFVFHSTRVFTQAYNDERSLNTDLEKVTDILGTLQEIRASRRIAKTTQ